jgi:hypothetical protein
VAALSRPLREPVTADGGWPVPVFTEQERLEDRRLWAVLTLTGDLEVARSIMCGKPVLARQLDPDALYRALRGGPLPDPDSYFRVRDGHLAAISEGGAFASSTGGRHARRPPVDLTSGAREEGS